MSQTVHEVFCVKLLLAYCCLYTTNVFINLIFSVQIIVLYMLSVILNWILKPGKVKGALNGDDLFGKM